MNNRAQSLVVFLLVMGIGIEFGSAKAAAESAVLEYPFVCPSCSEERTLSLRYGADATSVVEAHDSAVTPQIDPSNDGSRYLPGEWIAGPMTDSRAGRIQHWEGEIGTNFIEVRRSPPLRQGVRYVNNRLEEAETPATRDSWSIEDVNVSIAQGDDERTIQGFATEHVIAHLTYVRNEYDKAGAESSSEDIALQYDLWMAPALPFSPLPLEYEPFKGNHVPPYTPGPVEDRLIAELTEKLEGRGALMRAEIGQGGEAVAVEVSSVSEAPDLPMQKFDTLPVVYAEQVSQFAGPLFIASLLRGDMVRGESNASMNIGGAEQAAVSEWKVNDSGDLVIVLASRQENTSLFLARPIQGKPDTGTYAMTRRPDSRRLRSMDEAAMDEHSRQFQIYGIVQGRTLPTVVTGVRDGNVVIEQVDGEVIAGEVMASVSALPTDAPSEPQPLELNLSFEARQGLTSFDFRSHESRVAGR